MGILRLVRTVSANIVTRDSGSFVFSSIRFDQAITDCLIVFNHGINGLFQLSTLDYLF